MMSTGNGKTNIETEEFFNNETNDDFLKKFIRVYSSGSITKYINFNDIIKEKKAKYPFAIFNTDRQYKSGTHWWSFLDFYQKKDLSLFDSFGFADFKQLLSIMIKI